MPRICLLKISTPNSWRWPHPVKSWFAEISLALILSMNSSRRRTALARKCSSTSWRWACLRDALITHNCQFCDRFTALGLVTVAVNWNILYCTTGIFSGWPGGWLLSRECVHRGIAAHAGVIIIPSAHKHSDSRPLKRLTCAKKELSEVWFNSVFYSDARRGGFLRLC